MSHASLIAPTRLSRRAFLGAMGACALTAALPSPVRARGAVRVLAATYPAWLACDAAARGLPGIELDLLVAAQTGCPHDYAMTPRDRMKLEVCDVLVLNGGGFVSVLDERLVASLTCDVVDAGSGIDMNLPRPGFETGGRAGHDHDRDDHEHHAEEGEDHEESEHHHHSHGAGNPHYFACPSRFARMVANAARGLAARCPEQAQELARRADACAASMAALTADMQALDGDAHMVVQHDTLSWFFADTNFHVAAILQEEADEPPSAAALLRLVARMKEGGSYLLVAEPQYPSQVIDTLAAETGCSRVLIDTLASGGTELPAGHYEKVMRGNLARLKAAIGAQIEGLPAAGRTD